MKQVKYKQLSSLVIAQKRQVSCLTGKFYCSSLRFSQARLWIFAQEFTHCIFKLCYWHGSGDHILWSVLPGGMHEWKFSLQRTGLEFSICCKFKHCMKTLDLERKISELVAEPVILHRRALWVWSPLPIPSSLSSSQIHPEAITKLSFVRVYLGWQLQWRTCLLLTGLEQKNVSSGPSASAREDIFSWVMSLDLIMLFI